MGRIVFAFSPVQTFKISVPTPTKMSVMDAFTISGTNYRDSSGPQLNSPASFTIVNTNFRQKYF